MFHKFKNTKIKRFNKSQVVLLTLLIPLFAFTLHKEYYSLTKINHNANKKTLEITMRLFTDDIELILNKQHNKPLELGTKIEIKEANNLLNLYINQQFEVSINGKTVPYNFIGKEYEKNELFLYFEVKNITNINELSIKNSILTEYFSTQENIIKIKSNNQHKTMLLTKQHNQEVVFFE